MRKPSKPTLHQFAKAQFASLGASAIDLCLAAVLFRWAGFSPFWSTMCGAIAGGIINCVTNYEWTFRGTDRTMRGAAIRYMFVWGGSILLNAWGVKLAVAVCSSGADISLSLFMVLRILVSILVAVLWNFILQKHWVYRK